MSCNIVFDFVSPHNNEYWYKCTTCGASDWFAYTYKPNATGPIAGCVKASVACLDAKTKQMIIDAYNHGYAAAMEVIAALPKTAPTITAEEALKQ